MKMESINKIQDLPCGACGGSTSIHFVPSSGMDIQPTGMFRTCSRCGYEERIKALNEKAEEGGENKGG